MRRATPPVSFCLASLIGALSLGGCGARDCLIGIAHRDCQAETLAVDRYLPPVAQVSHEAQFPQDDAICRSYGLVPGQRAYTICRRKKLRERSLTAAETDGGFLQNPLLPDLR